jgi:flagellar export protein FliJ
MNSARQRDGKLAVVTRWYELQLEEARVGHVTAEERAERERERAKHIEQRIEHAHSLSLQHIQSERGVSADALRQLGTYTQFQAKTLTEQQARVQEAEKAVDDARDEVTRRYQAVFAMEQLRERRKRDATLEAVRGQQKSIDEHALLRAAPAGHPKD